MFDHLNLYLLSMYMSVIDNCDDKPQYAALIAQVFKLFQNWCSSLLYTVFDFLDAFSYHIISICITSTLQNWKNNSNLEACYWKIRMTYVYTVGN